MKTYDTLPMRYVKILFRDKRLEPIYLPMEQWNTILRDPQTIVRYKFPEEKEWNGRTINKSEVIGSKPDLKYSIRKSFPSGYVKELSTGTVYRITSNLPAEIDWNKFRDDPEALQLEAPKKV